MSPKTIDNTPTERKRSGDRKNRVVSSCVGVGAFVESGAKLDELDKICAIAKLMFPKTIDNTPTERKRSGDRKDRVASDKAEAWEQVLLWGSGAKHIKNQCPKSGKAEVGKLCGSWCFCGEWGKAY